MNLHICRRMAEIALMHSGDEDNKRLRFNRGTASDGRPTLTATIVPPSGRVLKRGPQSATRDRIAHRMAAMIEGAKLFGYVFTGSIEERVDKRLVVTFVWECAEPVILRKTAA